MRGIGLLTGISMVAAASGALAAGPAPDISKFVRSCQTQMYMSAAACTCMADKAKAELDAKEIAYLSIPGADGPAAAAATKAMSGREIAHVDSFMRTAPNQCQKAQ